MGYAYESVARPGLVDRSLVSRLHDAGVASAIGLASIEVSFFQDLYSRLADRPDPSEESVS